MWALVVRPLLRDGYSPKGIRIDGESRFAAPSQLRAAAFPGLPEDQVLDIRQFQMAFAACANIPPAMMCRRASSPWKKTVQATCRNARRLTVSYQAPTQHDQTVAVDGQRRVYVPLQ